MFTYGNNDSRHKDWAYWSSLLRLIKEKKLPQAEGALASVKIYFTEKELRDNNMFHSREHTIDNKTIIEAAMEQNAYQLIAGFLPYCTSLADLDQTLTYNFLKTTMHSRIF